MKAAITRQEIKKMERTAERGKWVGLIKLGEVLRAYKYGTTIVVWYDGRRTICGRHVMALWHTFLCFREDDVGKSMKDELVPWLTNDGLEFAQAFADRVVAECKADASNEAGWCKIRDAFVLPVTLNVGIWVLKTVLAKSQTH